MSEEMGAAVAVAVAISLSWQIDRRIRRRSSWAGLGRSSSGHGQRQQRRRRRRRCSSPRPFEEWGRFREADPSRGRRGSNRKGPSLSCFRRRPWPPWPRRPVRRPERMRWAEQPLFGRRKMKRVCCLVSEQKWKFG